MKNNGVHRAKRGCWIHTDTSHIPLTNWPFRHCCQKPTCYLGNDIKPKENASLQVMKSNKDDALYSSSISKEREVKCQAFEKKAVVNCGYRDYNESLHNPKSLFVPLTAGLR